MIKIEERFIKNGVKIREDYLNSLSSLIDEENELLFIKKEIDQIWKDSDNAINDIDEELMISRVQNLEKKLGFIQNRMNPHMEKIKYLRKKADTLFDIIKEKYPNINENDLKSQMYPFIMEIESKFSFLKKSE